MSKTKHHNVQVGEVDELIALRRDNIGPFDNEAVTLTDLLDGPPDLENKQRSINFRASLADQNSVEMQHVSVGQSTTFGGNEEDELTNANSRIYFPTEMHFGSIAGPRASVPLRNFEYYQDDLEYAMMKDLKCIDALCQYLVFDYDNADDF